MLAVVLLLVGACEAARTATPTAVPTATPQPTPTPVTGLAEAGTAIEAYAGLISRPDLTYHVAGSGKDVLLDGEAPWTIDADVSGEDSGGSIESGGDAFTFVYVDGTGSRRVKGRWSTLATETLAIVDIARPWPYVCSGGRLHYTGPAELAFTFAFACDPGYQIQTARMRAAGVTVTIDAVTLVIDGAGKPVTLAVRGTYPGNASRVRQSFSFDLAFRKVGGAVTIEGPTASP
jgi:hypothetical protein